MLEVVTVFPCGPPVNSSSTELKWIPIRAAAGSRIVYENSVAGTVKYLLIQTARILHCEASSPT